MTRELRTFFTFQRGAATAAVWLWVECDDNNELEGRFGRLSDDGTVFMPLDDYGFSTRFGWVGDRHGVTWQLNLA